jgi:hypothetical protein
MTFSEMRFSLATATGIPGEKSGEELLAMVE